jgi:hypothetical protein
MGSNLYGLLPKVSQSKILKGFSINLNKAATFDRFLESSNP